MYLGKPIQDRFWRALLAGVVLVAGCSEGLSVRGNHGSADGTLPGTCAGSCDQKSADGCYCDDLCEGYGDCCTDYQAICRGDDAGIPGDAGNPGDGGKPGDAGNPGDGGDSSVPGDDPWKDLSGSALVAALTQATSSTHAGKTYDEARDFMYGIAGPGVDVHGGIVECIYTGITATADGTRTPGTINTEHSWPRSDGAAVFPREGDLHHLFPTDTTANSQRGNLPFGNTTCVASGCPWDQGGSELGVDSTGTTVFEVRPAYRGDIARAHFYFSVRYSLAIPASEESVLRQWNAEDPPSQVERTRNDAIEAVQGNRNPFVDYPQLSARISDF